MIPLSLITPPLILKRVKLLFAIKEKVPNKLTELMFFVLPLAACIIDINIAAIPVCIVALFASVHEGF